MACSSTQPTRRGGSLNPDRLLSPADVKRMCGNPSMHTIKAWLEAKENPMPQPVTLGDGHSLRWKESELMAWIGRAKYSEAFWK